MDAHDEHDDLTNDGDAVMVYRARARSLLDEITQQTKQALIDADIDLGIYLLVPSSGEAIVLFGTPGDPLDDEWDRVSEIVSAIVRQSVGVDRTRCRPVACAATDTIADYPPTESPAQPSEPSVSQHPPMPPGSFAAFRSREPMRQRDITLANRFRLPATHPILAEVIIDPVNWYRPPAPQCRQ